MKKRKMEITMNGFTLWSRSYKRGMVFARQLEPTKGLLSDLKGDDEALVTPILVGQDGSWGRDLVEILDENDKLNKENEELQKKLVSCENDKIRQLELRIARLEKDQSWIDRIKEKLGGRS